MKVIGITGGIGCGKSNVTKIIKRLGYRVFDADAEYHRLLAYDTEAIMALGKFLPNTVVDGQIDRGRLRTMVFNDPSVLERIMEAIKPFLLKSRDRFIRFERLHRNSIAFLDVPLLFEGDWYKECDHTITIYAPRFLQIQRVVARKGMSLEKFLFFEARQLGSFERNRMADFVVKSGLSKGSTCRQVKRILRSINPK